VWNLYGPTETTVWSAIWPVESNSERICIGKPIHNTQIHLLDSSGLPVPVGVPGELHIAGDGLARGYQSRPELTAEKFVPNPFGAPSSRLYRTGDLGRYLPDGNIEFIGRTDNQVKVRGFRIELGEIEAVLAGHQDVKQVVLAAREEGEDKRLVAYVVVQPDRSLTEKELTGYARQKLPSYMVPSLCVFLESLPLTPNGKIDRRALPAPQRALRLIEPGDGLSDMLEFELANVW
jgi:acyl-CoA synthetase (AMP-forming)/AMP-acid ligase II